jgi:hypothetical protein
MEAALVLVQGVLSFNGGELVVSAQNPDVEKNNSIPYVSS